MTSSHDRNGLNGPPTTPKPDHQPAASFSSPPTIVNPSSSSSSSSPPPPPAAPASSTRQGKQQRQEPPYAHPQPFQNAQANGTAVATSSTAPPVNTALNNSHFFAWLNAAQTAMLQSPCAVPPAEMEFVPVNHHQIGALAEHEDENEGKDEDHINPDVTPYGHLEFDDSTFYITTRSVQIGRDQAASTQAKKHKLPPTIHSPDRPPSRYHAYTKSYISEEGGLLGPESDGDETTRPTKRRKTDATTKQQQEQQQEHEAQVRSRIISSRKYIDHTPGAALVDVDHLRPSGDFVARVRIHGKAPDVVNSTKGISRDHAKIQYNDLTRVWEIAILGKNGIFHEEVYYGKGAVITLRSGDSLQIQSVCFQFWLTGVEKGMTGAEDDSVSDAPVGKTYAQGGKEMSFEFEFHSRREGDRETNSSSVVSGDEPLILDDSASGQLDEEMEDASLHTSDQEDGTIRETVERDTLDRDSLKKSPSTDDPGRLDQSSLPPKKRGPGRPPKNGVMSKREERLLKKLAQEEAKKNLPPQEPGEQPQKRKVGRPRKHPRPDEEGGDQPEKRKYKPRKPKGEGDDDEADSEKPPKERSQKAKTPPLVLNKEDFTAKELAKPTKNYQMLIDEIMLKAPPKGYSLKQVYKRIQEKWPYYYFSVDTKGWESSVRHNLLGSDCFEKKDGHWHRVPGVPLESGKKQKKPSPAPSSLPPGPGPYPPGGYGPHPFQPPGHPPLPGQQQPIANSTGPLSQPNLPPRYPPNGQAYHIAQAPPHRPGQPPGGVMPGQPPLVRPGFPPPPQAPTAAPHAYPGYYANANAPPRPQYPAGQAPPPFGTRPQQPPPGRNPGVQGPVHNSAQRPPPARPGQPPPPLMPPHGFQPGQTHAHAQPNVQRTAAPAPRHQHQPSLPNSAPPAPLGPVIDPIVRDFIKDFKAEVIKQLQAREGKRSEAVAMSVINRGLGLTDRSLTPDCEQYEKLILDVFNQHKATFPTVLASKRRAQEASRAATPSNVNRTMAGALPQANGAKAVLTNGHANASSTTVAMKREGSTASGNAISGVVPTAAPKPAQSVSTTAAPASKSPASNPQPATTSVPRKPSNSPAPSVPAITKSPVPASTPANPARAAPAVAGPAAVKPVAGNNGPNAPPSTPATSATAPPRPAIANPAPTPKPAAVTAVPSAPAASSSPAPAPNGPRAGSTASASTPTSDNKDVQLLDPKLVTLILSFKTSILPTLVDRLGLLMGESLVVSAANRLMGLTDETFVQAKDEQHKQNLNNAEKTLMTHLETRLKDYARNRSTSK